MNGGQTKSLLLIHRYFWPERNSAHGLMLKDIAEHHVGRGDRVRVVTATADRDGAPRRAEWAAASGVQIDEVHLLPDRGRGARHRILSSLRFTGRVVRVMVSADYDAVFVGSYPFLVTPAAVLLAARVRGKRSLFYVQDILSSRLRRRRGLVGLIGRATGLIDRILVSAATVTVTLTHDMRRTLGSDKPLILQNYLVDSASPSEHAPQTMPTLIYAGNMGAAQGLDHLLDAATCAIAERPFRLLLLGDGSLADHLRRRITSEDLSFVSMEGQVSRSRADEVIGRATIGVVASEPELYKSAFPSKTLSYLAQGLPVLLMCEPTVKAASELVEAGVAAMGSPTDAQELADAIVRLIDAESGNAFDRSAIADWTQERFGKDQYFATYDRDVVPAWLG